MIQRTVQRSDAAPRSARRSRSLASKTLQCLVVGYLTIFGGEQTPVAAVRAQRTELQPGQTIDGVLKVGAVGTYYVSVESGQFLRVILDQGINDLVVSVFDPAGASLGDWDFRWSGPETVSQVVAQSGAYRLEVRAVDKLNVLMGYRVRIDALRPPEPQDADQLAAERLSIEGKRLVARSTAESFRRALAVYDNALLCWRGLGDQFGQAQVLNTIGFLMNALGNGRGAIARYEESLALWRSIPYAAGEGEALNNLAAARSMLGEKREALDLYRQALDVGRKTVDLRRQALSLTNLSAIFVDLGQPRDALESAESALKIWDELGDPPGKVAALNAIATASGVLGDVDRALSGFREMLSITNDTDRRGAAVAHRNMGRLYFSLGDCGRAQGHIEKALVLFRELGDRRSEAYTILSRATCHAALMEFELAIAGYTEAIAAAKRIGDPNLEAVALNNLGTVLQDTNELAGAEARFSEALSIPIDNSTSKAVVLTNLGRLRHALGDRAAAANAYGRALVIFREGSDGSGEAAALSGLAAVELAEGQLKEARAHVEMALVLVESMRRSVSDPDLRASFLAQKQTAYELNVAILMALHRQDQRAGYDRAALQASERARARALLDLLANARSDIRRGVDPRLSSLERSLRESINATAISEARLLRTKHTKDEEGKLRAEIESLLSEHQAVLAQIRAASPGYAALTQPSPLSAEQIQKLVDPGMLLLEFKLGDIESTLWAVSSEDVASFNLPPRVEIESAARKVYAFLSTGRGTEGPEYAEAAARLSQIVLGPVSNRLGSKRILIVADGILQYIPFGALPRPDSAPSPSGGRASLLSLDNSFVYLPSASVLASSREAIRTVRPSKTIAVMADPVFSSGDPRVQQPSGARSITPSNKPDPARGLPEALQRAASDAGLSVNNLGFPRLRATRNEAEQILRLVPEGERLGALDFEASRSTAMSPSLGNYRIVHFATHGFLDTVRPELTGLVFSLVDRQGAQQDGFLRLNEVYNLNLPADLVVLSGCQTGLGRVVKGEGIVGLTRGFMYAGAARIVVSLWKVDDRATAELMARFYKRMLGPDRLSPALALQAAQVELARDPRWRSPYYWAGFVLFGEPR